MDQDIVPELLTLIEKEFDQQTINNDKLKKTLKSLEDKKATYVDVNEFSIEVGDVLSDVLSKNITSDTLPDGRMYYNIAERILNPTLKKNYELISRYAVDVQTILNHEAGLKIKGQTAPLNQDRIDGIVNRLSNEENFEKAKWLLKEPVVNFSQSIVDDVIQSNVEFHTKSGLRPKIERRATGKCCDWCQQVVGMYDYPNVPKDIYKRHRFCRCIVDYNPGNGKRQNVWSKEWIDPHKNAKIEARKLMGIDNYNSLSSGAKYYIRSNENDLFRSKEDIRKERYAYTQYETIKNSDQSIESRKIYSNIGKFREMNDFEMDDVKIAFNHVFNDIHELENGRSLFVPDYDMAQSWSRLISGDNIREHDLILLRHERLEHRLMYIENMDYRTAHEETAKLFDYSSLVKKYNQKRE